MKRLAFTALLLLALSWCTGPVIWQFITSIKPDRELARIPPLLPQRPTLGHYAAVLHSHFFPRIIFNSTVVASSTTVLSLAFGSLAAFGLSKLRLRNARGVLAFVLATSMFPPIATAGPLFIIIRALGLRDTLWALVLTHTVFSLPLAIWVMTHFFESIPQEIYQAARIDGCSRLQVFLRVMLPLAAPGIFTTGILVFIYSWNEFLFALTFTATEASRTIPVGIALFPGLHELPWGDIAAASIIVTAPLVFIVMAFQRKIIEGLTAGAVKG